MIQIFNEIHFKKEYYTDKEGHYIMINNQNTGRTYDNKWVYPKIHEEK